MFLKKFSFLQKRKTNRLLFFVKQNFSNGKETNVLKRKKEVVNDWNRKANYSDEEFNKTWKYIIRNNYINKISSIFKKNETKYETKNEREKRKKEEKTERDIDGKNETEIEKEKEIGKEKERNNDFVKTESDCYFVLGGEGVGKRFFIEKAKERFLNEINERSDKRQTKHVFFEYNFKETDGDSFQMKLYKLDVYLRTHLLKNIDKEFKNGKIRLQDLFDYLKKQDKNFFTDIQMFFKYILNNESHFDFLGDKEKTEIKKYIDQLEKKEFGFVEWNTLVSKVILQKLNVKCFCNYYNEMSAAFYFLKMMAEYKEHMDYYKKSKNILYNYSNGHYLYTYFFFILQFLETQFFYKFYFVLYNFHLGLLCMQPERSFFFFQKIISENGKQYHFPIIIHSIKNLEMMKFLFVYNNIIIGNYIKEMKINKNKDSQSNINNVHYMMSLNYNENNEINQNLTVNNNNNINNNNINNNNINNNIHNNNINNNIHNNNINNNINNNNNIKKKKEKNNNISDHDKEWNTTYRHMDSWTELENYELIKNNLIEINEFSYEMIKCVLIPQYTKNEKIVECIYKTVGGNIQLIKSICKGLYEMNKENNDAKMLKDLEKDRNENIRYDIDEEEVDTSMSTEEIIAYRKYEKEKLFLKNMTEDILCNFILDFEHRIITFFSLPEIEKMKQKDVDPNKKSLNSIEFYFTIFEVIKYFLKKNKVFCKNILNLNNPILLGLIDVNIIQYNYENRYIELTNQFYEVLLKNYIDFKYKQFPLKLRAQYNIHHVLNYNVIAHEYKLLETQ